MRIGLIGAGHMGQHHARVLSQIAQSDRSVSFLGIADPRSEVSNLACQLGVRHFLDWRQMINDQCLTAVSVCVPTSLHAAVACELLNKGVHVLVEKPIAATIEEATQMAETARAAGKVLMTGHIEYFNSATQTLFRTLKIGANSNKIESIFALRLGLRKEGRPLDAGVVLTNGIHDIHLIIKFLGIPEKIEATGFYDQNLGLETEAKVWLYYPNDVLAKILLSWNNKQCNSRTLIVKYRDSDGSLSSLSADLSNKIIYHNFLDSSPINCDRNNALLDELQAFIVACRGETANPIPPEEAIDALAVALEATRQIHEKSVMT